MSHRIWEIQYAGSPKVLWSGLKPTPEQLAIADRLGIHVSPDDTFAAVASSILERVADAIGCPPRVVSDRQRELADELELDLTDCASSWSAFMRIQEAIQLSNLEAVRRMGLKPGDMVFKFGRHLGTAPEGKAGGEMGVRRRTIPQGIQGVQHPGGRPGLLQGW